jgi:hypothetical protein
MLRLVHPSPKGQEKRTSKGRRSESLTPNAEEQQRIYAALDSIARAYGGRDVLASVMGVSLEVVKGRKPRSYGFAILLARAAGVPVEQILSPGLTDVRSCSVCGRKGAK